MDSPRQMWMKRVNQIPVSLMMVIILGKFLTALLVGIVATRVLAPWGLWLIGLGMLLEVTGNWFWFKGFPLGSVRRIWLTHRKNLGYGLASWIIGAKMAVGLGVGALFAELFIPYLNGMFVTLLVLGFFAGTKFFQIKT